MTQTPSDRIEMPQERIDSLVAPDMKWDAGVGFRAMAKGQIIRVDIAFSEEEVGLQMMVGHPF